MRDIVPRPSNKENAALKRSASCAGQSSTKVTVEMKTVVTPQSKAQSSQFITPKTPAHLSRSRSNAAALFAKKTPCSSTRSDHEAATPAGVGEITPGIVKRLIMRTPTPAQPTRAGAMTPGVRSGITPVKRKMAGTPLSCASGSKVALNQSTTKLLSASQHETEEESHVTVAVRLRPLNLREKKESCCVVETGDDGLVTVAADNASLSFQYDHCFGPTAKQSEVFCSLVHPLLSKALEGYNACLFSYGQTGSGKTYSMMGAESGDMGRDSGIIPRFSFSLFERLAKSHNVSVEVSYFEIYNEKIRDLLSEDVVLPKTALRVREHPQLGPYVEGLAVHSVASFESLQGWLRLGLSKRATAASAMNDKSSRSHCIFSVTLTQSFRRSKVHLVDLAGSERLASTAATGDRLKEGVSINTSLLTLGKVISALADKQRRTFVPYRDSLLTWLLSDSLGGNARTVMLATVSPARLYVEETLATLRYACQARTIVNRPQLQPAATPVQHRQLQEEVERLRAAHEEYAGAGRELTSLQAELTSVRHKLHELEQERAAWEERVRASEDNRSRQTAELARRGVAECSCPALRLLTSDPLLSLCFALPDETCTLKVLGSQQPPADIALQAPLVAPKHCVLEWRDDMVWLIPDDDETAETYVNGELVHEELPLEHGDRLALAGELFLLVQLEPSTSAAIDHEWARMELSLAQNTKLNLELVEAKEKAILELQATRAQVEQLGVSKSAVEAELELRRGEQDRLVAALKAEVKEERRRREMMLNTMETSLAPFASSLLQELGELDRVFVDAGAGLGLHEMRCLVREATQRCRQLGLHYVFSQVQQAQADLTPGQPALQPCVRVRGKDHLTAECSPHTFLSLLEALRQCADQDGDMNAVLELTSALAWQEEAESSKCILESSVTVDIAPFTRHMLSLSLTVHEESPAADVDKHLLCLHTTLAKLQAATRKQAKVQTHINAVKNALCQLERACLHPELDSYQHSEPSSIAHQSSVNHHNLESYEHTGSVCGVHAEVTQSYMCDNTEPECSVMDDHTTSTRTNLPIVNYDVSRKSEDGTYSSVDVDMVLQQLRDPSLSSSVSTTLHSPPSISAQPSKSNMRQPAPPNSPTKEGESQEPLLSPNASDYELLAELGQSTGTYGNVALVRHAPSTAVLSAKRYEVDRLTAEEADLIQQEVILARQLSHPNILPCLASFVWDQSVCILSPLMDLGSCRDLINNHFPDGLPELAIAFILRDTLHGLDYIHRQGLIHRSIRASHLLVSGGGRVRISGLRYACSLVQHGRWQRTVHEFPASTLPNLNWLSPELLEQNLLGYSEKSDVYSVGITTCEMANGVVPYGDMPAMLMLTEKLGGRGPQLLDRFAFPFIDNNPDGCQADSGVGGSVESGAEVGGLSAVERREFSEPFHYLVELCLERQPDKRPSPARLLTHPFFKQCRRGPLLSLTSVITPALRLRASAASSHDDMLTDTAAERFSDLQLSSVEWDF